MTETTIAIIAVTVGLIAQIILQIMTRLDAAKLENSVRIGADLLAVKSKIASVKLEDLTKMTRDVHTLVNSNMGVQLKLNMELSEWKAVQTGKKEDVEAAVLAKQTYERHMAKQHIVDQMRLPS